MGGWVGNMERSCLAAAVKKRESELRLSRSLLCLIIRQIPEKMH